MWIHDPDPDAQHWYYYYATYLDAQDALPEEDVSAGGVHVVIAGITRVDHQAVHKLHGLGTLAPQLTGHNHLAAELRKLLNVSIAFSF
jgi:hypothetical protein